MFRFLLSHKVSPTWPSPRVRENSPAIVAAVALLHAAVAGYLNYTYGYNEDTIGTWLLGPAVSAAGATVLWALLAIRIDPGKPGWKRLPVGMVVDPHSLPQRRLRWRWLLWYVPLSMAVSAVALLLAPATGYGEPSGIDIVVGVLVTSAAQAVGALLLGSLMLGFTVMPLVLVVIGCTRMRDGRGLPPTGPVLVSTGLALLVIPPLAMSLAVAGPRSQAGQLSLLWTLVAGVTGFLFVLSAAFLVVYAIYVRLRDRVVPGERPAWYEV